MLLQWRNGGWNNWGRDSLFVFVCLAVEDFKLSHHLNGVYKFSHFFFFFFAFFPGSFTDFKVHFWVFQKKSIFNKIKNNNNDHGWFINFGLDQFIPTGPIIVLIQGLLYFSKRNCIIQSVTFFSHEWGWAWDWLLLYIWFFHITP